MRQTEARHRKTPNAKKYVLDLVCNQDMSKSFELGNTVNKIMLKNSSEYRLICENTCNMCRTRSWVFFGQNWNYIKVSKSISIFEALST